MDEIANESFSASRQEPPLEALRPKDAINAESYAQIVHPGVDHLDDDQDYLFRLRGYSLNPLVDAASGLLGMVLRVRDLQSNNDIDALYQRIVNEILSIEVELTERGYEHATLLAYRYILCTFIDEAVMAKRWGSQSNWAEHSLLSRFHNETWGGEKVFSILARLQQEPQRYRDLLEFIYLCLCLGFSGRYGVRTAKREYEFEQIMQVLGEQLAGTGLVDERALTEPLEHVLHNRARHKGVLPIWGIVTFFCIAMGAVYFGFSWALDHQAEQISSLLDQLYR